MKLRAGAQFEGVGTGGAGTGNPPVGWAEYARKFYNCNKLASHL
jgi:hypothetical protein